MKKRIAGAGLALGLVAGGAAGLALELSGSAGAAGTFAAATTPTTDGTTGTTDTNGTDDARPDRTAELTTVLQPLVDAGTITQAQMDAVITALEAAGPIGGGHGGGPGGRHGMGGASLDVVATTLGITADEVRTALQDGTTLAELATQHGSTADALIAAIVADRTADINQAVTDGKLTQAEADTKLADLTTRVTDFVNNAAPMGGDHGPGGGHRPDDADDDSTTAATTPATDSGS